MQEQGYIRDRKKWLTNKAFFEIGLRVLREVVSNINSGESGLHETNSVGMGSVVNDTTKKIEFGSDLKLLSVPQTILNSILRLSKSGRNVSFPISIEADDFEEFETLDDVKVAVVYCIDLSSTMRTTLGKTGKSRIEAAKKALWGLYVLNKKFFPNDSIHVVGFGSMASIINPFDIPFLQTYTANDNFLHYTNYQSAFRLARKILQKSSAQNKRIVLITDGQPSACFVDNDIQKNNILSEKPYVNFYVPDEYVISKIKDERGMKLNVNKESMVYLCYRYKKVDPKINMQTLLEAKKCYRDDIEIDSIVISEERELLEYVKNFEKELKGKTFHVDNEDMNKVLVNDYITKTRKVLR